MRTLLILIIIFTAISCDNKSCSEEVIANKTNLDLTISFVSQSESFNNQVFIEKNTEKTVGEVVCALGGVIVNYSIFDSIYIQNSANEILKVFKEDTTGKNIYNVDKYWSVNEPSKNHFVYTYEITEEDLE